MHQVRYLYACIEIVHASLSVFLLLQLVLNYMKY